MKIVVTSILVDDQERALRFYTEMLGCVELLLEPDGHPAARPFKNALVGDGIPFTSFGVADVQAEFDRLSRAGVRFTQPPVPMGPVTTAVLDDTCGNLIQLAQRH